MFAQKYEWTFLFSFLLHSFLLSYLNILTLFLFSFWHFNSFIKVFKMNILRFWETLSIKPFLCSTLGEVYSLTTQSLTLLNAFFSENLFWKANNSCYLMFVFSVRTKPVCLSFKFNKCYDNVDSIDSDPISYWRQVERDRFYQLRLNNLVTRHYKYL